MSFALPRRSVRRWPVIDFAINVVLVAVVRDFLQGGRKE